MSEIPNLKDGMGAGNVVFLKVVVYSSAGAMEVWDTSSYERRKTPIGKIQIASVSMV